uniref:Uncharacterized protein n=1 Tax=Aegilops tauschii subsp. strangulata TaxID=200361 RepID=A0A453IPQ9_AEGTS
MTTNLLTQVQARRQVLGQLQSSMALLFFLMCHGTRRLLVNRRMRVLLNPLPLLSLS